MIFNCKETDKPVGVMLDGIAFITSDFCHKQHFVNVATVPVSEEELQEHMEGFNA